MYLAKVSVHTMMLEVSCLSLTSRAAQRCRLAPCYLGRHLLRVVGGLVEVAHLFRHEFKSGEWNRSWIDQTQPAAAQEISCPGLATAHDHDQLEIRIQISNLPRAANIAQTRPPGLQQASELLSRRKGKRTLAIDPTAAAPGPTGWQRRPFWLLSCSLHFLTCTDFQPGIPTGILPTARLSGIGKTFFGSRLGQAPPASPETSFIESCLLSASQAKATLPVAGIDRKSQPWHASGRFEKPTHALETSDHLRPATISSVRTCSIWPIILESIALCA